MKKLFTSILVIASVVSFTVLCYLLYSFVVVLNML